MSLKSDEDLRTVIAGGGVAGGLGGEMPAYPHLESHEIERLVDFVRSFCD